MSSQKGLSANSGFTLLEIMISLAIAGIIFVGIFLVFDKVFNAAETVKREADLVQVGQRIVMQMIDDLDSCYFPANSTSASSGTNVSGNGYSFSGSSPDLEGFVGNSTIMAFPSASSLNFEEQDFPQQRINRVGYVLQKSVSPDFESDPRFELVRTELPFPGISGSGRSAQAITLSNRVSALSVEFLDQNGMASDSWGDPVAGGGKGLSPVAVRVSLQLMDDQGRKEAFSFLRKLSP